MAGAPDPRPPARVHDPELLRRLHLEWRECALALDDRWEHEPRRSLHHIHSHPRDDVRANLVMLCGDGVRGCHGRIENEDEQTRAALGRYLRVHRPDFFEYLTAKFKAQGLELPAVAADEWLRVRLA